MKNKNEIIRDISNLIFLNNIQQKYINKEYTFENTVNSIAEFLVSNSEYMDLKSYLQLADLIVLTIESVNAMIAQDTNFDEKELIKTIFEKLDYLSKDIQISFKVNIFGEKIPKYLFINNYFKNIKIYDLDIKTREFDVLEVIKKDYNSFNILLLRKGESLNKRTYSYFDEVIDIADIYNLFYNISKKTYFGDFKNTYSYNYLKYAIEKASSNIIDTLIIGNSYPLTGIIEEKLNNRAVNLSIVSQDLYYSLAILKKVINKNQMITKCILGIGHYVMYHDISMSKAKHINSMVGDIYYPILKDKHHFKGLITANKSDLNSFIESDLLKYIFDIERIDNDFKKELYENNRYFNELHKREMVAVPNKIDINKLNDLEKMEKAKIRANHHNKMKEYKDTLIEYEILFKEFVSFCNEKNIDITIVIFPKREEYKQFINKQFKAEFYKFINELENKYSFKIIDFSDETYRFNNKDFIDFDHMSEAGAIKITNEINKLL